jgi:hypothetical protein
MRRVPTFALASALCLVTLCTRSAAAQAGRLDSQTQYDILAGTGIGGMHGPLLAVILWHGPNNWYDSRSDMARDDSVYRAVSRRAQDEGRSFFGSGRAYGIWSAHRDTVFVEGKAIRLQQSDSAVVVMVAVAANGTRTVHTAKMRSSLVPENFWGRTWSSGDTTFIVRVRYPKDVELLRGALLQVPAVAAYLNDR